MDPPSQARGRSPSAPSAPSARPLRQHPHIKNVHSPSPSPSPARPFHPADASHVGLGIDLASSSGQPFAEPADYADFNPFSGDSLFPDFHPPLVDAGDDGFKHHAPVPPDFAADFTIFPPSSGEPYNAPLFPAAANGLESPLGPVASPDNTTDMAQAHPQPTPPHLLISGSFAQGQYAVSSAHSRNVSLGPEAALLPGQDWSQYRQHKRSPSEYSEVSSVGIPSPHLGVSDSFDHGDHLHSPMQRPLDVSVMQELNGLGGFSLSDRAASPSHSPALSPRILPQQAPDGHQQSFTLPSNGSYLGGASQTYAVHGAQEAFPSFSQASEPPPPGYQQAPVINIDFAPPPSRSNVQGHASLDTDALTPPDRRGRPRAVTDPYNTGSVRSSPSLGALSPHLGSSLSPNSGDSSRSLSPLDGRQSPGRRRQSTSAVPTNALALRLAEPEQGEPSGPKRVQKHPANFQCSLCPKRFTRAYNLRSHLRTHTDERPFVCTVCGKAFARQHDRKRHEGLHSGEKKFVCKGDLETGGQWGCGRKFARADALGRHFRSEAGRICIKSLLDEEMLERERQWGEQRMAQQQAAAAQQQQHMAMGGLMPSQGIDSGFPAPPGYMLPQALLAQYPALANMDWTSPNMQGDGKDDDISGRSSFDASDYDQEDEAGYMSGPGTGFGPGGMGEGFGEMGYASDYGSCPTR